MQTTSGLNKQIFLAMAVVGLLPLFIMAFQNNYFARKVIKNVEEEHLAYSLRSRLLWLRTWTSHIRQDFYHVAFERNESKIINDQEAFLLSAQKLYKGHINYRSITVYKPNWIALARYPKGFSKEVQPLNESYRKKLQSPGDLFIVGEDYRDETGNVILPVGQPLLNKKGDIGAYLVAEINLTRSLNRILSDTSDLDSGGSYVLASKEGRILYKSPSTKDDVRPCNTNTIPSQILTLPPWQVEKRESCAGQEIYVINGTIPELQWLLIGQFDTGNVLDQFENYVLYGLITAFCTLIILILLAQSLSKRLAAPLDELTRVSLKISTGHHDERLPPFKEAYVQEVGIAFNGMIDALEKQGQVMIQNNTLSTLGKMSSSLVHEMRNPLSSIKINLQGLARKVKDDLDYSEMADISLMQVDRLEGMFSDLLQFSKPLDIHKKPILFASLLEDVLTTVDPEAKEKEVLIKVEDNLQEIIFHADKKNSCRALINLVSNAIQWSEPGSVVVINGRRCKNGDGVAIIRVTDQGPGLLPEQMEKLFQPFFTTRDHGTGLGLANVKKVMDYQGGSVLAENGIDRGAVFSLIFKD